MQTTQHRLASIQTEVGRLIRKLEALALENELLKVENSKLKSKAITDGSTQILADQDKIEDIKQKIDQYVAVIDDCIERLG